MKKRIRVVLKRTTYPGTTDEDLRAVPEAGSKLRAGTDFHLPFSPERDDPGNAQSKVKIISKVIGGCTPACLERAKALYGRAIKTLVPVSSSRAAEATKLRENKSIRFPGVLSRARFGRALHPHLPVLSHLEGA